METELRFLLKMFLLGYLLTKLMDSVCSGPNRAHALECGKVTLSLVKIKVIVSLGAQEQGSRAFRAGKFLYRFCLWITNLPSALMFNPDFMSLSARVTGLSPLGPSPLCVCVCT